jgi:hypothetical protein
MRVGMRRTALTITRLEARVLRIVVPDEQARATPPPEERQPQLATRIFDIFIVLLWEGGTTQP